MKILRAEKFQPRKRSEGKQPKSASTPRRTDWDVLMQHDRVSGKLNLKSKEFIKDPGSVKRLLEAEMIYPDGKLTPAARKKCAELGRKLQAPQTAGSVTPALPGAEIAQHIKSKQAAKLTASDWAVLVKYDRNTGNLLKYDPKTGELDETSRAILKDPSIIQRLIDNNMILPGGWLTPEAKTECARIEQKLKARPADGYRPKSHLDSELKSKGELLSKGEQSSKLEQASPKEPKKEQSKTKMASGPEAKSSSAKLSKAHASRQHYPEPKGQPGPNPKPEVISGKAPENLKKAEDLTRKDMQTFFENIPYEDPEPMSKGEQLPDDHSEPLSKDQNISYEDSSAKSERQSNGEKSKAQVIPATMQTKQPKQGPGPIEDSASAETMGNNVWATTSTSGHKSKEKRRRRGRGPDSTDGNVPGPPAISMRDIFHVVFKRRTQIVLFFAAVFLTVAVGTFLTKPTYESSAQILVKLGRESVFMPASGDSRPIINFDREERINSEIEILSSRALAEKVVAQIGPTALYPPAEDEGPGLLERFFPNTGEELSPEEKTLMRFESAVYGFMNSLAVGAIKKSNIIEIYFSHENPQMAALVVNTLADTYLDHHVSVHKAPKSVKFFQDQSQLLRTKMETSEEALKALKKRYNITSLAEERTLLLQQSSSLRAELNTTLSQKVEAEKRIGQMRRQLATTPRTIDQGEETDRNTLLINTLEARLVELQIEEKKLLAKYTDQSRPVTNVSEEISMVKQKLAEQEGKSYGRTSTGSNPTYQNLQQNLLQNEAELNAIKAKAETQQVHLVAYQGQLDKLNRIEVELDQLQQQVDVNRENYRLYLTKLEESRISDAMDSEKITNVSLIEPARAPREPVSPKKMLNLILAIFLGAFGGLGLAFFMEYLDDKIEKIEDVEEILGLPVLASVPVMGAINTEEVPKDSGDEKFQM